MAAPVIFGFLLFLQVPDASSSGEQATPLAYDTRLEKGVELYSQSKYLEAEVYFRNLTTSDPTRKEAFLWLGYVHRERDRQPDARAAFQRYAELSPQDPEGFIEVARTYEAEGNGALARLWYKKAQDVDPQNSVVREALNRLENEGAAATSTAPASPPVAATPGVVPATDPSGTAATTGADATEKKRSPFLDFWFVGVAGVTGAREVWWGRAIIIAVMVFGMIGTFGNVARAKEKYPFLPVGYMAFGGVLGSVFSYVLFWGIPLSWNAGWLVGYVLVSLIGIVGTLQAPPEAQRF